MAKHVLPHFVDAAEASKLAGITIFFGANDAALPGKATKQHVPLDEYRATLKSMIDYVTSLGVAKEKIVLIGPPPVVEKSWEEFCRNKGKSSGTAGENF